MVFQAVVMDSRAQALYRDQFIDGKEFVEEGIYNWYSLFIELVDKIIRK